MAAIAIHLLKSLLLRPESATVATSLEGTPPQAARKAEAMMVRDRAEYFVTEFIGEGA